MQTRSSPVQILPKSVEKPRTTCFSLPIAFILPASLSSMGSCSVMSQKAEGSMMKVLISHLSVYFAKEEWISRIQPHENADLHFIPPFLFYFQVFKHCSHRSLFLSIIYFCQVKNSTYYITLCKMQIASFKCLN